MLRESLCFGVLGFIKVAIIDILSQSKRTE